MNDPVEHLQGFFGPENVKRTPKGDLTVFVTRDTLAARTLPDRYYLDGPDAAAAARAYLNDYSFAIMEPIFVRWEK